MVDYEEEATRNSLSTFYGIFRIGKDFFSLLTGLFFHRARTCAILTLALIDRGNS